MSAVVPAKAGTQSNRGKLPAKRPWAPAFAGATRVVL